MVACATHVHVVCVFIIKHTPPVSSNQWFSFGFEPFNETVRVFPFLSMRTSFHSATYQTNTEFADRDKFIRSGKHASISSLSPRARIRTGAWTTRRCESQSSSTNTNDSHIYGREMRHSSRRRVSFGSDSPGAVTRRRHDQQQQSRDSSARQVDFKIAVGESGGVVTLLGWEKQLFEEHASISTTTSNVNRR